MDEKQTIIHNVDVSECTYSKIGIDKKCYCEQDLYDDGTPVFTCDECTNCYYKQLKRKEQECDQLRNKLNSNIERMNEQNEKLHNEIQTIKQQMKTILMVSNNGKYRPVKNSTKEQCYQVLGNIQELLGTNIIRLSEVTYGTNP